jgi:CheY-like chemotaxis protein
MFEWRPAGELPRVYLDPAQLAQVLINLSINARDAMPRGGALALSTGVARVDEARAASLGVPAGRYVTLVVRDTGAGMDAATRTHIFEPFFTTKPLGEGTGLGLSTVQGIVAQSGGAIVVDSAPDAGTTFTVLFPAVAEPERSTPRERATQGVGHETVMVVEDDAGVRTLTRRLLERHGYAVLEASDGREALAMVRSHVGRLDMVLTDVRMPHLSGGELAMILRQECPQIALSMMTGYAADELEMVTTPADVRIIEKPFTVETLLSAVREALGAVRG